MWGLEIHWGLFIWIGVATGIVGYNILISTQRIEKKLLYIEWEKKEDHELNDK